MWCFIVQATETIKVTLNSNACICYKLPLRAFFCFITLLLYNIIYASLSNFAPFSLCVFSCKVCQKPTSHSSGSRPSELKIVHPFPAGNLQNIDTDVACEWIPLKATEAGGLVSTWLRVFPSWDIICASGEIRLRLHLSPSTLADGRQVTRPPRQ